MSKSPETIDRSSDTTSQEGQAPIGSQLESLGRAAPGRLKESIKEWAGQRKENFVGRIREGKESIADRVRGAKEFADTIKTTIREKGGALRGKITELPSKIKEFAEGSLFKTIGAMTPEGRELVKNYGLEKARQLQEKFKPRIEAATNKFWQGIETIKQTTERGAKLVLEKGREKVKSFFDNMENRSEAQKFQIKFNEIIQNGDIKTPEGLATMIHRLQELRSEIEESMGNTGEVETEGDGEKDKSENAKEQEEDSGKEETEGTDSKTEGENEQNPTEVNIGGRTYVRTAKGVYVPKGDQASSASGGEGNDEVRQAARAAAERDAREQQEVDKATTEKVKEANEGNLEQIKELERQVEQLAKLMKQVQEQMATVQQRINQLREQEENAT